MKQKGHKAESEELKNRKIRSTEARKGGIKKQKDEINCSKGDRDMKRLICTRSGCVWGLMTVK